MSLTHLTLDELERRAWAAGDELATEVVRRVLDDRDEQINDLDYDLRAAEDEAQGLSEQIEDLEQEVADLRALCKMALTEFNELREANVIGTDCEELIKKLEAAL